MAQDGTLQQQDASEEDFQATLRELAKSGACSWQQPLGWLSARLCCLVGAVLPCCMGTAALVVWCGGTVARTLTRVLACPHSLWCET